MVQYVFPAVFYVEEDNVTAVIPDLNIFTDGSSIEEAYLYLKDYLRVYCTYANKYDMEIDVPSTIEEIQKKYAPAQVMLVDAVV